MINFPLTIDSKPIRVDKNGNEIFDLIIKDTVPGKENELPIVIDYFLVTAEQVMRPDLVSHEMYGYIEEVEGILKMNGISNPFSIDESDVLYVFDISSMKRNMRTASATKEEREDIRNQYITPEKKSNVDPAFRSFDKRDTPRKPNAAKGNQPALPPNYAAFGDSEIQIRNGKIVFGPNVTKQEPDCDKPLSKSEFISRLIKNRLKNS